MMKNFGKITFKKWHLIYYCLAAFDLLTIGISLAINHEIVSHFDNAVETNEHWMLRSNNYLRLGRLAADANAPGNFVFQSQNVPQERKALQQALNEFEQLLAKIKNDLNDHVTMQDHLLISAQLDKLKTPMKEMSVQAELIFNALEMKNKESAGHHMAAMDGAFYRVQSVLDEINTAVNRAQQRSLELQKENLNALKLWEYVIAVFICVIVVSITVYGHLLARRIRESEAEKVDAVQRIADAQMRNKAVLEAAADAIITIDEQGSIESFNHAATKMFGYEAGEIIGRNVNLLMPEKDAAKHDAYIRENDGSDSRKVIGIGRELIAKHKDGSLFPIELAISRIVLMGKVHFTGIIRDISERKRIDKMKSEFVSSVSHELRTPLTSIHGSLSLLKNEKLGELPPQAKDMIVLASRNSQRLSELINDLLDLQKLDADAMDFKFESFELNEYIKSTIEAMLSYADQFKIRLHFDGSENIRVWGDQFRLTQVLTNLLSNAIKFSKSESDVLVKICLMKRFVKISVIDNGPGISPEFAPILFERFTQADATASKQHSGTGLGLNISKCIVEKNHGEIGFENLAAGGAEFYFTIPRDQQDRAA